MSSAASNGNNTGGSSGNTFLFVQNSLDGKWLKLVSKADVTFLIGAKVKKFIETVSRVPFAQQRIVSLGGEEILDDTPLRSYGIASGDRVVMILKEEGGAAAGTKKDGVDAAVPRVLVAGPAAPSASGRSATASAIAAAAAAQSTPSGGNLRTVAVTATGTPILQHMTPPSPAASATADGRLGSANSTLSRLSSLSSNGMDAAVSTAPPKASNSNSNDGSGASGDDSHAAVKGFSSVQLFGAAGTAASGAPPSSSVSSSAAASAPQQKQKQAATAATATAAAPVAVFQQSVAIESARMLVEVNKNKREWAALALEESRRILRDADLGAQRIMLAKQKGKAAAAGAGDSTAAAAAAAPLVASSSSPAVGSLAVVAAIKRATSGDSFDLASTSSATTAGGAQQQQLPTPPPSRDASSSRKPAAVRGSETTRHAGSFTSPAAGSPVHELPRDLRSTVIAPRAHSPTDRQPTFETRSVRIKAFSDDNGRAAEFVFEVDRAVDRDNLARLHKLILKALDMKQSPVILNSLLVHREREKKKPAASGAPQNGDGTTSPPSASSSPPSTPPATPLATVPPFDPEFCAERYFPLVTEEQLITMLSYVPDHTVFRCHITTAGTANTPRVRTLLLRARFYGLGGTYEMPFTFEPTHPERRVGVLDRLKRMCGTAMQLPESMMASPTSASGAAQQRPGMYADVFLHRGWKPLSSDQELINQLTLLLDSGASDALLRLYTSRGGRGNKTVTKLRCYVGSTWAVGSGTQQVVEIPLMALRDTPKVISVAPSSPASPPSSSSTTSFVVSSGGGGAGGGPAGEVTVDAIAEYLRKQIHVAPIHLVMLYRIRNVPGGGVVVHSSASAGGGSRPGSANNAVREGQEEAGIESSNANANNSSSMWNASDDGSRTNVTGPGARPSAPRAAPKKKSPSPAGAAAGGEQHGAHDDPQQQQGDRAFDAQAAAARRNNDAVAEIEAKLDRGRDLIANEEHLRQAMSDALWNDDGTCHLYVELQPAEHRVVTVRVECSLDAADFPYFEPYAPPPGDSGARFHNSEIPRRRREERRIAGLPVGAKRQQSFTFSSSLTDARALRRLALEICVAFDRHYSLAEHMLLAAVVGSGGAEPQPLQENVQLLDTLSSSAGAGGVGALTVRVRYCERVEQASLASVASIRFAAEPPGVALQRQQSAFLSDPHQLAGGGSLAVSGSVGTSAALGVSGSVGTSAALGVSGSLGTSGALGVSGALSRPGAQSAEPKLPGSVLTRGAALLALCSEWSEVLDERGFDRVDVEELRTIIFTGPWCSEAAPAQIDIAVGERIAAARARAATSIEQRQQQRQNSTAAASNDGDNSRELALFTKTASAQQLDEEHLRRLREPLIKALAVSSAAATTTSSESDSSSFLPLLEHAVDFIAAGHRELPLLDLFPTLQAWTEHLSDADFAAFVQHCRVMMDFVADASVVTKAQRMCVRAFRAVAVRGTVSRSFLQRCINESKVVDEFEGYRLLSLFDEELSLTDFFDVATYLLDKDFIKLHQIASAAALHRPSDASPSDAAKHELVAVRGARIMTDLSHVFDDVPPAALTQLFAKSNRDSPVLNDLAFAVASLARMSCVHDSDRGACFATLSRDHVATPALAAKFLAFLRAVTCSFAHQQSVAVVASLVSGPDLAPGALLRISPAAAALSKWCSLVCEYSCLRNRWTWPPPLVTVQEVQRCFTPPKRPVRALPPHLSAPGNENNDDGFDSDFAAKAKENAALAATVGTVDGVRVEEEEGGSEGAEGRQQQLAIKKTSGNSGYSQKYSGLHGSTILVTSGDTTTVRRTSVEETIGAPSASAAAPSTPRRAIGPPPSSSSSTAAGAALSAATKTTSTVVDLQTALREQAELTRLVNERREARARSAALSGGDEAHELVRAWEAEFKASAAGGITGNNSNLRSAEDALQDTVLSNRQLHHHTTLFSLTPSAIVFDLVLSEYLPNATAMLSVFEDRSRSSSSTTVAAAAASNNSRLKMVMAPQPLFRVGAAQWAFPQSGPQLIIDGTNHRDRKVIYCITVTAKKSSSSSSAASSSFSSASGCDGTTIVLAARSRPVPLSDIMHSSATHVDLFVDSANSRHHKTIVREWYEEKRRRVADDDNHGAAEDEQDLEMLLRSNDGEYACCAVRMSVARMVSRASVTPGVAAEDCFIAVAIEQVVVDPSCILQYQDGSTNNSSPLSPTPPGASATPGAFKRSANPSAATSSALVIAPSTGIGSIANNSNKNAEATSVILRQSNGVEPRRTAAALENPARFSDPACLIPVDAAHDLQIVLVAESARDVIARQQQQQQQQSAGVHDSSDDDYDSNNNMSDLAGMSSPAAASLSGTRRHNNNGGNDNLSRSSSKSKAHQRPSRVLGTVTLTEFNDLLQRKHSAHTHGDAIHSASASGKIGDGDGSNSATLSFVRRILDDQGKPCAVVKGSVAYYERTPVLPESWVVFSVVRCSALFADDPLGVHCSPIVSVFDGHRNELLSTAPGQTNNAEWDDSPAFALPLPLAPGHRRLRFVARDAARGDVFMGRADVETGKIVAHGDLEEACEALELSLEDRRNTERGIEPRDLISANRHQLGKIQVLVQSLYTGGPGAIFSPDGLLLTSPTAASRGASASPESPWGQNSPAGNRRHSATAWQGGHVTAMQRLINRLHQSSAGGALLFEQQQHGGNGSAGNVLLADSFRGSSAAPMLLSATAAGSLVSPRSNTAEGALGRSIGSAPGGTAVKGNWYICSVENIRDLEMLLPAPPAGTAPSSVSTATTTATTDARGRSPEQLKQALATLETSLYIEVSHRATHRFLFRTTVKGAQFSGTLASAVFDRLFHAFELEDDEEILRHVRRSRTAERKAAASGASSSNSKSGSGNVGSGGVNPLSSLASADAAANSPTAAIPGFEGLTADEAEAQAAQDLHYISLFTDLDINIFSWPSRTWIATARLELSQMEFPDAVVLTLRRPTRPATGARTSQTLTRGSAASSAATSAATSAALSSRAAPGDLGGEPCGYITLLLCRGGVSRKAETRALARLEAFRDKQRTKGENRLKVELNAVSRAYGSIGGAETLAEKVRAHDDYKIMFVDAEFLPNVATRLPLCCVADVRNGTENKGVVNSAAAAAAAAGARRDSSSTASSVALFGLGGGNNNGTDDDGRRKSTSSIGGGGGGGPDLLETAIVPWMRPRNFLPDTTNNNGGSTEPLAAATAALHISARDMHGGSFGDYGVQAALRHIADRAALVRGALRQGPLARPDRGLYLLRLCDTAGCWRQIVIDDLLPLIATKYFHAVRPLGSRSAIPREMWSALLQKALAKLMGGFDKLRRVETVSALQAITGMPIPRLRIERAAKPAVAAAAADASALSTTATSANDDPDSQPQRKAVSHRISSATDEDFWEALCRAAPRRDLVVLLPRAGIPLEEQEGIDAAHSFTVLDVAQGDLQCDIDAAERQREKEIAKIVAETGKRPQWYAPAKRGNAVKLVKLRNASRRMMWCGEWSPVSQLWEENPELLEVCRENLFSKNAPIGRLAETFWVPLSAVRRHFSEMCHLKVRSNSSGGGGGGGYECRIRGEFVNGVPSVAVAIKCALATKLTCMLMVDEVALNSDESDAGLLLSLAAPVGGTEYAVVHNSDEIFSRIDPAGALEELYRPGGTWVGLTHTMTPKQAAYMLLPRLGPVVPISASSSSSSPSSIAASAATSKSGQQLRDANPDLSCITASFTILVMSDMPILNGHVNISFIKPPQSFPFMHGSTPGASAAGSWRQQQQQQSSQNQKRGDATNSNNDDVVRSFHADSEPHPTRTSFQYVDKDELFDTTSDRVGDASSDARPATPQSIEDEMAMASMGTMQQEKAAIENHLSDVAGIQALDGGAAAGGANDVEHIAIQCLEANLPFVDLTFPPGPALFIARHVNTDELSAIASASRNDRFGASTMLALAPSTAVSAMAAGLPVIRRCECWMRPSMFEDEMCRHVLCTNISPTDLAESDLSDVPVQSAIMILAERDHSIKAIFSGHRDGSSRIAAERGLGLYRLTLYQEGWWSDVVVDDYVPTALQRTRVEPVVTHNKDPAQQWAAILHKSLAKVAGGYAHLLEADVESTLEVMTGSPLLRLTERVVAAQADAIAASLLWACLSAYHESYHVYLKTSRKKERRAAYKALGLDPGASYTLLDMQEVKLGLKQSARLLKFRDPFLSTVWSGAWGPGHENWAKYPEVAEQCGVELNHPKPAAAQKQHHHGAAPPAAVAVGGAAAAAADSAEQQQQKQQRSAGCFWMSYKDALEHFVGGGVCFKPPTGWFDYRVRGRFIAINSAAPAKRDELPSSPGKSGGSSGPVRSSLAIHIRAVERTRVYIILTQCPDQNTGDFEENAICLAVAQDVTRQERKARFAAISDKQQQQQQQQRSRRAGDTDSDAEMGGSKSASGGSSGPASNGVTATHFSLVQVSSAEFDRPTVQLTYQELRTVSLLMTLDAGREYVIIPAARTPATTANSFTVGLQMSHPVDNDCILHTRFIEVPADFSLEQLVSEKQRFEDASKNKSIVAVAAAAASSAAANPEAAAAARDAEAGLFTWPLRAKEVTTEYQFRPPGPHPVLQVWSGESIVVE